MTNERTNPDPLDDTAAAAMEPPDQGANTEVARLTRERDELKDLLLRKSAEFDNYRKRVERDRQATSESITAGVVEDLLPLVDDMERALAIDPGAGGPEAYRKGVELIHRQLTDLLRKRGVTPIEALGADFDPNVHQAVLHEPSEGHRDGEVIEDMRRGYMIGDRLLRPSMVKVAKG